MRYALCDDSGSIINVIELDVPEGGAIVVNQDGAVFINNADGTLYNLYAIPADHSLVADSNGEAIIGGSVEDGSFVPPEPTPRTFEPLEFIERFTPEEQIAIVTAAQSSPEIQLWLTKALGAKTIEANDARTIAGMQALVDAGLLTEQRMIEILGS